MRTFTSADRFAMFGYTCASSIYTGGVAPSSIRPTIPFILPHVPRKSAETMAHS
jgi:hypothetical protein